MPLQSDKIGFNYKIPFSNLVIYVYCSSISTSCIHAYISYLASERIPADIAPNVDSVTSNENITSPVVPIVL